MPIEDVTLADPKDREVLVRIGATGVCHSDLSAWQGRARTALPLILGHEAAGTVERIGSAVSKVRVGDRVILSWAPHCGHCFYCHRRLPTLCDTYGHAAKTGGLWDGTSRLGNAEDRINHYSCVSSFAEYAVVPETGCLAIHTEVPLSVAALVGCAVTTGIGAAVNDAAVRPGDTVCVFGIGGVGINALQGAAIAGADRIIALDIRDDKEAVARSFGATDFLNAGRDDLVAAVAAMTAGRGADSAIDCTGRPDAIVAAFGCVRSGGTLVLVGIAAQGERIALPAADFPNAQKRVVGSNYGGGVPEDDFKRILDLYRSGRLDLDRQVGARIALDRVNEAFAWLQAGVPARTVVTFD